MRNIVLLVDDDRAAMYYYLKALRESSYVPIQALTVDHALTALQDERTRRQGAERGGGRAGDGRIVLVVLDIMMPFGPRYEDADHAGGLRTGVLLYRDVARILPGIPVIVLTNATPDLVSLEELVTEGVPVHAKSDVLPFDLVDLVAEELQSRA